LKKLAGLWIDHRKAVIVMVSDAGEETKEIGSNMEGNVHAPGRSRAEESSTEDIRDRQFGNQLDRYYDEVVDAVRNADTILIFGPGEAKGELKKRLGHARIKGRVLEMETEDKMTDRQIAAKVREHSRS
jgi:stalled ribosome rescue protein Dom34